MLSRLTCFAALLCLASAVPCAHAQADDSARADAIRQALREGSRYLADTYLDARGMGRGDYDLQGGTWHEYEPAWHTGQSIYGLLAAYDVTGHGWMLDAARRGGDWWTSLAVERHTPAPGGLDLTGYVRAVHGDNVGDRINFTTIADGTPGLFELWRVTGDTTYAAVPTRAARWAIEHLYLPDEGLIYDLVDAQTGEVWTDRSPFFEPPLEPKHVARPNNEGFLFYDAYRYSGDPAMRETFVALCNSLVDKQRPSGLWDDVHPNRPPGDGPNEHPRGYAHPRVNTWYAESLVYCSDLTENPIYLEAAARTARATQAWQTRDGRIFYRNFLDGTTDRSSITGSAVSFAGILWLMLQERGYDEFDDSIERSVDWVLANRFAADHPDPNLRGAFFETRARRDGSRVWLRVRGIATAFGLRFLADYYRHHLDR